VFSREPAYEHVLEAIEALGPIASSRLTYVEVRSAFAAAREKRRISQAEMRQAVSEFARVWMDVDVIELDAWVADTAAHVCESFGLRSHDSVQLASALQDADVTMIALDKRLRRAAAAAGLDVAP